MCLSCHLSRTKVQESEKKERKGLKWGGRAETIKGMKAMMMGDLLCYFKGSDLEWEECQLDDVVSIQMTSSRIRRDKSNITVKGMKPLGWFTQTKRVLYANVSCKSSITFRCRVIMIIKIMMMTVIQGKEKKREVERSEGGSKIFNVRWCLSHDKNHRPKYAILFCQTTLFLLLHSLNICLTYAVHETKIPSEENKHPWRMTSSTRSRQR